MVGHGESSAGSYLADPTSPIPSHCASIVLISTLRVKLCSKYSVYYEVHWLSIGITANLYTDIGIMAKDGVSSHIVIYTKLLPKRQMTMDV